MKRSKDGQSKSAEELKVLYHELSREIFQLKNELAVSRKLDKPHLLKEKKKERARALTFLKQKTGTLAL